MVRKKVLICGCYVALVGFISPMILARVIPINNSNGAIIAIGGLIAEVSSWFMLFLGIWLYKTKRIKKVLG
jgi:hypothetical protein